MSETWFAITVCDRLSAYVLCKSKTSCQEQESNDGGGGGAGEVGVERAACRHGCPVV